MTTQSSNNPVYDTTIRLFILLLIVAWCLLIMYPFVNILLWSLILAMAMFPLHRKLSAKFGGKPKLASFIIVFSILAIVILPTGLLIGSLVDEMKELKVAYDNGTMTIPPPTEKVKEWPLIGEKLYGTWQAASDNIEQLIVKYKDQLIGVGSKVARGILSAAGAVVQIMIALLIAGTLLAMGGTGENLRKFFRKVSGGRGDEFADLTLKTVGTVVKGVLGEATLLAMLNGTVFMLADIPYAGIWSLLVFVFAALQIPALTITIPIMIYCFAVKETVPAVAWTVSLLAVSLSDNILTPIMLGKGAPVPMPVIYIGVLGGFILSGFIGLFTGAIILSLGYKLFVGWINTGSAGEKF